MCHLVLVADDRSSFFVNTLSSEIYNYPRRFTSSRHSSDFVEIYGGEGENVVGEIALGGGQEGWPIPANNYGIDGAK